MSKRHMDSNVKCEDASPGKRRRTDGRRSSDNDTCTICLDQLGTVSVCLLPCGHGFHGRCIHPWIMENPTCPVCREPTTGGCSNGSLDLHDHEVLVEVVRVLQRSNATLRRDLQTANDNALAAEMQMSQVLAVYMVQSAMPGAVANIRFVDM